jgi:hypothetical protein
MMPSQWKQWRTSKAQDVKRRRKVSLVPIIGEDVWQRYNQCIETAEFSIRVSPSHSYNADRAGLGWMDGVL